MLLSLASLVSANTDYVIPVPAINCSNTNSLHWEAVSGFKTLQEIDEFDTIVRGCRLTGGDALSKCSLFIWRNDTETTHTDDTHYYYVEMQCSGWNSCGLAHYHTKDKEWWPVEQEGCMRDAVQGVMNVDNSGLSFFYGANPINGHEGISGNSCNGQCTVRAKMIPAEDGHIHIGVSAGKISDDGVSYVHSKDNRARVLLSGATFLPLNAIGALLLFQLMRYFF